MRLPEELLRSLEGLPGFDRNAFGEVHASGRQSTSIRLNTLKPAPGGLEQVLASFRNGRSGDIAAARVPWCDAGAILSSRPSFTFDPLLHAGAYYVQEAASMFLGHALAQLTEGRSGLRALDLCAAPGGKSTHLASLPAISLLLSNEIIRTRVPVLYENIVKWGAPHVFVAQQDPRELGRLAGYFDIMLVDAPCSGSGLFRKDPAALSEWSPRNVDLCSQRQQRILADALPALREDGILVYATCSYSPQEDEEVADWLVRDMGMQTLPLTVPPEWGITETRSERAGAHGYRFFPHRTEGEGLYLACFRQTRDTGDGGPAGRRTLTAMPGGTDLPGWLGDPDRLSFYVRQDELMAVPADLAEDHARLSALLQLRRSGTRVGKLVRGRLNPDHELAMSTLLNPDIPRHAFSHADAIRYLRKEPLEAEGAQPGWNLAAYGGLPLGLMKCMPGRLNNYYPADWRIRAEGPVG